MYDKQTLKKFESGLIQRWLDTFDRPDNGEQRSALLDPTGEFIAIRNLPLPDGLSPDYVDALIATDGFPGLPPIGIYILNKNNESLTGQLQERFNLFRDSSRHEAQALPGYTWICYHYADNRWSYRADDPARGDNIRKFLMGFYAELGTGG